MKKNLKNFRSIFSENKTIKDKILIATSKKKNQLLKFLSLDLHKIIPNSKLLFKITKKQFFHELEYNNMINKNITIIFLNYQKNNNYLLISNSFNRITYQLILINMLNC